MEPTNLGGSDISGATDSVPQLPRVFSYPVEGGYVSVYLANVGFEKMVIITFDDTHREFAYAVQTLVSSPVDEAYEMLENAEKEFSNPFIQNPFTKLLHDNEARTKLIIILRNFLSGE